MHYSKLSHGQFPYIMFEPWTQWLLIFCADDVIWSLNLRCSDREAEPQYQGPAHTPALTDSIASTTVNHGFTPLFIASNN